MRTYTETHAHTGAQWSSSRGTARAPQRLEKAAQGFKLAREWQNMRLRIPSTCIPSLVIISKERLYVGCLGLRIYKQHQEKEDF